MNTIAVSTIGKLTLAGSIALLSLSQAFAEDRSDVLDRIAPVGKVAVEGQAAPVSEAAAPVVEAAAEVTETTPTTEAEAVVTEAAAEVEAAVTEAVADASAAAGGADAQALATTSGCMGCHQIDAKVVGPAYKEVAAKYKGDAAALDMLVTKVLNGGSGTWGQIPMPPNAHVGEEKVRTIVEWVLSL